ncbi:MAG TPA: FISUMP domain-containing protein, partial [Bacteroidales bacterium]|nr:FISUMP domain-containing protein [Bacteroidales bacterium]
ATNGDGTSYDNEISFTTYPPFKPEVTSAEITSVTETTAVAGGSVTADNGAPVTEKGVCWSTSQNPTTADNKTIDNGAGSFISNLTGLQANTTYYVRAYAINSEGTGYGNSVSFKTQLGSKIIFNPALSYGSLADIDGNTYKVITIGTQTWMAENLQTTKFNDGTPISSVTDGKTWAGLSTPAYSWYDNNEQVYKKMFGALYNWYAVNTGKLCPAGWHVSTNTEWATLITYLGGSTVAGGKLKEAGTSHWDAPNTNATNESGFTALPGGGRSVYFIGSDLSDHYGDYISIGDEGLWWTYTNTNKAIYQNMYSESNGVITEDNATEGVGFSVRCVKD